MLFVSVVFLESKRLYFLCVTLQESLAQAVAEEMQKVYQNELGPEPIPFTVSGHAIDDEDVSHVGFMYLGFT